jgi:hypothetical protein
MKHLILFFVLKSKSVLFKRADRFRILCVNNLCVKLNCLLLLENKFIISQIIFP